MCVRVHAQLFFIVNDAAANATLGEGVYDLAPLADGSTKREPTAWQSVEVPTAHTPHARSLSLTHLLHVWMNTNFEFMNMT